MKNNLKLYVGEITGILILLFAIANLVFFDVIHNHPFVTFAYYCLPYICLGAVIMLNQFVHGKTKTVLFVLTVILSLFFIVFILFESTYNIPAIFYRIFGKSAPTANFADYFHAITSILSTIALVTYYCVLCVKVFYKK